MSDETKPVDVLSEAEAKAELARLAVEIARHDEAYHRQDAPIVSDAVYDALKQRNLAIEHRFPHLKLAESPTDKVGAAVAEGFGKITHKVSMLSLDNAFNDEDVRDFVNSVYRFLGQLPDNSIAFTAEPKIDGLSMSIRYEDGKRRHPRRRHHRRKRHRQCENHLGNSQHAARRGAVGGGSARRGLHGQGRFSDAE